MAGRLARHTARESTMSLFGPLKVIIRQLAGALVVGACLCSSALYADNSNDPYQRVELITGSMLALIEEYHDDYEQRADQYFAELTELLDTHVNFAFISRGVMGAFASRASDEQIERFTAVFRGGLVETYGRGLISYNNIQIELLDHPPLADGQRSVTVRQQIISNGTVYPLQYSIGQFRDSGDWQIINMVINGINLGKTFRTQFVQAANRNGGDIDAVIDGWATTSEE